jgi:isoquinoline 1-oxidoreductase beta subunit
MLVAAIRCAPRFGSRLASYDAALIASKPGVVTTVEVPGGLAVVARTYWQARLALDDAKLVWHDDGSAFTSGDEIASVYAERLADGPYFTYRGEHADTRAKAVMDATYQLPFQAHATMEPMNCTAFVAGGRCEIWAPTQGMELAQAVAAQVTGLPAERITIHRTLLGGGFGRRLLADFIKQALLVAMVVQKPVKLIWPREEDMTHDFYRPAVLHRISATLLPSGLPQSLTHRVVSPSQMLYVFPRGVFPQLKDWTEPAVPPENYDTMAVEGALDLPYDIPAQQVEQHRLDLDVPVSVWRTTGHGPNNFAVESFIDELATAARQDPVEFRRAMLRSDRRAQAVLTLAAERSQWGRSVVPGAAQGVALAKAFGGYAAAVAELTVREAQVKVHRLTLAVDCGRVLDPGIAASNIEGGAVWGLSAMKTQITFDRGRTQQFNFDTFTPLQLRETPPIEVHFVSNDEKPGGTGELGPVPVPAAVCNAIFAVTRVRIRGLPLSRAGLSFA